MRETQQLRYFGKSSEGFAEIPRDYVTDISDVTVYGGPELDQLVPYEKNGYGPNTFSMERDGARLFIDWEYEPTAAGDELIFVVEYQVVGGLWIYPQADLLEWRAIPADRSGLVVPRSQVTVNLLFTVGAEELAFDAVGSKFTAVTQTTPTGQQVTFTADETLPAAGPGDGWCRSVLAGSQHAR